MEVRISIRKRHVHNLQEVFIFLQNKYNKLKLEIKGVEYEAVVKEALHPL